MSQKILGAALIFASYASLATTSFAGTEKPTIGEMLTACPKSDEPNYTKTCQQPIAMELLATALAVSLKGRATIGICLPESVDGQHKATIAIISWLRDKPDMQLKSQDDGLFAAMKALYSCS